MNGCGAPLLVVVSGHPGSGKSTLAGALGDCLSLPVFTKDTVKEILFDVLGTGDRTWSQRLGAAALAVLTNEAAAVLGAGGSVVVEANFDPVRATPELLAVLDRTGAAAASVVVHAPPEVLVQRYRERADTGERHPGHLDELLFEELVERSRHRYVPPDLPGPRLEVDTGQADVGPEELAAELRDRLAEHGVNVG